MQPSISRKKLIVIISSVVIVMVSIGLVISLLFKPEPQSDTSIKIQNYDSKVKNLSGDIREALEGYLYKVVTMNTSITSGSVVGDAYIRDESDNQKFDSSQNLYTGTFIIDIASLKQSYQGSYQYYKNNPIFAGDPVYITCLPTDKLIYGDFDCKDLVQEQGGIDDDFVQYLPYDNFSFKISPNEVIKPGTLTLVVDLRIPDTYLKGSEKTRQEAVKLYKDEVFNWIRSMGFNPEKYTYKYNYDDNGNPI